MLHFDYIRAHSPLTISLFPTPSRTVRIQIISLLTTFRIYHIPYSTMSQSALQNFLEDLFRPPFFILNKYHPAWREDFRREVLSHGGDPDDDDAVLEWHILADNRSLALDATSSQVDDSESESGRPSESGSQCQSSSESTHASERDSQSETDSDSKYDSGCVSSSSGSEDDSEDDSEEDTSHASEANTHPSEDLQCILDEQWRKLKVHQQMLEGHKKWLEDFKRRNAKIGASSNEIADCPENANIGDLNEVVESPAIRNQERVQCLRPRTVLCRLKRAGW